MGQNFNFSLRPGRAEIFIFVLGLAGPGPEKSGPWRPLVEDTDITKDSEQPFTTYIHDLIQIHGMKKSDLLPFEFDFYIQTQNKQGNYKRFY